MTIGPRAESLTLPEPARTRTIFSRTRAILDERLTGRCSRNRSIPSACVPTVAIKAVAPPSR